MCICASYIHIDIYMYIWICKLKEHKKKVYHTQTTLFLILLRLSHFFSQCMHTTWPADCGERFVFVVVVLNAIARCCCCRFAAAFVMTSRICLHLHLHLQCGARFLQFPLLILLYFTQMIHKWCAIVVGRYFNWTQLVGDEHRIGESSDWELPQIVC